MQTKAKDKLLTQFISLARQCYGHAGVSDQQEQRLKGQLASLWEQVQQHEEPVESKEITILLSDLRGFSAMAEKCSNETVIGMLNRYFTAMGQVIKKYGGTIDKYMGDSIMVLFSGQLDPETELESAIACAVEMQMAMSEVNSANKAKGDPELHMGIGINTGIVVAGQVGSDMHREYTVIGDEVNLASRIESHSLRGQVLISESTFQKAKKFISVGDESEVFVKGKSKKVKLYELIHTLQPKKLEVPRYEIRHSPRVEVDMPVNYQCLIGKTVSIEVLTGQLVDISYEGMCAILPQYLPLMADIKLTLSRSLLSDEHSDIYAKAVRMETLGGYYQGHFEFTDIDEKGKAALKEFIDRILEGI